jgi:hypothetical protein
MEQGYSPLLILSLDGSGLLFLFFLSLDGRGLR